MDVSAQPRRGATLAEIAMILVIIAVVGVIIWPVFQRPRPRSRISCLAHMKQIGLGVLQYIQDYDDTFPPAVGVYRYTHGEVYPAIWGPDYTLTRASNSDTITVPGIIAAYVKPRLIFSCPSVEKPSTLTYMYNDLAALQKQSDFLNTSTSVLVAEGENEWRNAGHAYTPNAAPLPAVFNKRGTCDAGDGATIQKAATRHHGGANYTFADGHAKWHKPETIFFPPRDSDNPSHLLKGKAVGLKPGKMIFAGKLFYGTFHIR